MLVSVGEFGYKIYCELTVSQALHDSSHSQGVVDRSIVGWAQSFALCAPSNAPHRFAATKMTAQRTLFCVFETFLFLTQMFPPLRRSVQFATSSIWTKSAVRRVSSCLFAKGFTKSFSPDFSVDLIVFPRLLQHFVGRLLLLIATFLFTLHQISLSFDSFSSSYRIPAGLHLLSSTFMSTM